VTGHARGKTCGKVLAEKIGGILFTGERTLL